VILLLREQVRGYRHIFKLDPEKPISESQLMALCNSGTDAIIVGGTLGITRANVSKLLSRLRAVNCQLPLIHEVSTVEAIVNGFDFYLVPLVLNARNPEWLFAAHHKAIKELDELIDWKRILLEGYIVLNQDSSVAQLTESQTELSLEDICAYAAIADQMLQLPILYIEYSGSYGDVDLMRELKCVVNNSQIFYGGGINTSERARIMSRYADTIVVGNIIYQDFAAALATVPRQKLL
jgi:putative glycerol-1-phosphate prenyltransferase